MDKEDVIHAHTQTNTEEYYCAIKKDKIFLFVTTWMDLEAIMLNAISQTEKDKYDFVYIWNLKNKTNEQTLKKKKNQKQSYRHRKQTSGCRRGGRRGRGWREERNRCGRLRGTNFQLQKKFIPRYFILLMQL